LREKERGKREKERRREKETKPAINYVAGRAGLTCSAERVGRAALRSPEGRGGSSGLMICLTGNGSEKMARASPIVHHRFALFYVKLNDKVDGKSSLIWKTSKITAAKHNSIFVKSKARFDNHDQF
jgi:hypothetical protein